MFVPFYIKKQGILVNAARFSKRRYVYVDGQWQTITCTVCDRNHLTMQLTQDPTLKY